ncbi:ATP-binding protein [Thiomicrospira microaerophila]|uniref:ATP-binding protein n=1 Tax=Thiomicrospira microaerophila TaxID=406020 RepID=UPI0006963ACE|nr:ATP-binding protein [Thiomicrospira microaerophila]
MTPSNVETRVKVLYEIAMAMGNTLDEKQLLSDCLKVFLRKFNGLLIAFYDQSSQQVRVSLPRRGMKPAYIEQLETLLADEKSKTAVSGFVESWLQHDGQLHYAFKVGAVGWLSLISSQPIDALTLGSLGPVCDKLATSIRSCRTNQQLIEQEHDLQAALYDLKKAQQARDSFLANMSHEIRTPLNGILGFLHQLEDTSLDKQQKKYLSIIQHSSETLVGIINDILDFSKMDAGKLTLASEPFHLLDCVTPIIELFRAKASQQGTCVEFIQQGHMPARIKGDALRLKQIISNLVSNAVKFSVGGHVSVTLQAKPSDYPSKVDLTLSVKDTGIGIATEKLMVLGQPFVQAENSTTRDFGGTGLGLAICKGLLALMGSSLQVKSELGKGSCFYFNWQAEMAADPLTLIKPKPSAALVVTTYPDKRILLVEDNKVNQMLMKAILAKMQIKPDLAENGQQAVEQFQNQQACYDLVLMDINMPIMDGVEATQRMREFEVETGCHRVPIVALTANVLRGDREKYLSHQMDEVLAKPIDMTKLYQVFETFLLDRAE